MGVSFCEKKSGIIEVLLTKKNKEIILIVSDNGSGKNNDSEEGFGSLLIDSLALQLGAMVDFSYNDGTTCTINIPFGDYNE